MIKGVSDIIGPGGIVFVGGGLAAFFGGLVGGEVDVIEPFADDVDAEDGGIDGAGGGDVGVAEEFLDDFEGHALAEELGGAEVAEVVGGDGFVEGEGFDRFFDDIVDAGDGDAGVFGVAAVGDEEGAVVVGAFADVGTEGELGVVTDVEGAGFVAFADDGGVGGTAVIDIAFI